LLAKIAIGAQALGAKASPGLNFLLGIFSGFAFGQPFCGPIKVNQNGVALGWHVAGAHG